MNIMIVTKMFTLTLIYEIYFKTTMMFLKVRVLGIRLKLILSILV